MGVATSKQHDYPGCIRALEEGAVDPADEAFWETFWTLPQSVEDIINHVKPEHVRRLKRDAPHNLALLLHKVVARMRQVVTRGAKNSAADFKAALNCVRLVTRLLPFIEEDQSDDFLEAVFWRGELPSRVPGAAAATPSSEEGESTPSLGTDEVHQNGTSPEPDQAQVKKKILDDALLFKGEDPSDPLAIRLLNAIVNLLFYPNFTVSPLHHAPAEIETFPLEQVWESGVGVQNTLASAAYMHSNRTEILRCLMVLFSEALYRTPEETGHYVNKWLDIVACNASFHSLALFYSLLNTALSYDPVGWGMPYNHVIFADSKEGLADTCLQVLAILLNHEPSPLIMRHGAAKNIFVEYLRSIDQVSEFEWIYEAVHQLLSNPIRAHSTYLPNSTKQVSCHQEVLMFFWKLIQENQSFFRWLLTRGDVTKVLDPILHFLHEGRKDTTQRGLIHLGTFTLLYMSGEREFGVQLNKPFLRRLTIDLPTFTGNYADYLILVFHRMMVDGHDQLETLYECLLTILANVSPYIKAIGMVTSNKLMHLFKLLSRPRFLFANERNHRYIFFLLEVFNNFVQYQYEGNYQLIYAMMRYREGFSKLARIDLSALNPPKASAPAVTTSAVPEISVTEEKLANLTLESSEKSTPQPNESVLESESAQAKPIAVPGAGVFPHENEHEQEPHPQQVSAGNQHSETLTQAEVATTPAQSEKEVPGPHSPAPTDASFVPTAEWIESWRASLPIGTIIRLLGALVPQIPSLVSGSSSDEAQILEYLRNTTLVGLLPVPHPILIRRYQSNSATNMWFTTFMWGVVYLRNVNPPLFYSTHIKLFTIKMIDTPAP